MTYTLPEPLIYEGDDSPLYDEPKGFTADQMHAAFAAGAASRDTAFMEGYECAKHETRDAFHTEIEVLRAARDAEITSVWEKYGFEKKLRKDADEELEALRELLTKALKLLKRSPKITKDIFIGSDFVSWGTHAANLVKELEGEIK